MDAGQPLDDAGSPPPADSGPEPSSDSGPPPPRDAGFDSGSSQPDAAPPPARYLDRCTEDGDCASEHCVDDVGGTRMCTVECVRHSDCASEHVCAAGLCRRDDTGASCSNRSACALELCAGDPSAGLGECTRTCVDSTDCPAGFACSEASGIFICVNIERSCARCSTGLCLGAQGCTTTCRAPADCPLTLPGMPYACSSGICEPSSYVIGPDPIGASCRWSGDANLCRSGVCITDDSTGSEMCTQRCTEAGGCGPGFGCVPADDGTGGIVLLCQRAGSRALGQSCTQDAECDSGICHGSSFCTRLCTSDGLCPSGLRCAPAPGSGIATCQP